MTPEDEEFQRISREIKRRTEEDDDIQDYKKPWVGLTDKEIEELRLKTNDAIATNYEIYKAIERKLKEKNF
jgi:hypothetical protein